MNEDIESNMLLELTSKCKLLMNSVQEDIQEAIFNIGNKYAAKINVELNEISRIKDINLSAEFMKEIMKEIFNLMANVALRISKAANTALDQEWDKCTMQVTEDEFKEYKKNYEESLERLKKEKMRNVN